jgi:uncharacterized integral membrane protein
MFPGRFCHVFLMNYHNLTCICIKFFCWVIDFPTGESWILDLLGFVLSKYLMNRKRLSSLNKENSRSEKIIIDIYNDSQFP